MHILQIIPHYVPAYGFGGPLQVAHSLGKALVQAGHSVTVCTTNLASEDADLDMPVGVPVTVDGVTVFYEPVVLSRYWGFSPASWRRVAAEIDQADVILVHAHYQFANWAGAWLARRAQKPYVVFAHGSLHRKGLAHKSTWRKRLYLRLMEHDNFRQALFIAFNAPEEKSLSLYGELGRVVPSGIDPRQFVARPKTGYFRRQYPRLQGKLCFLFLGRLDVRHKGLDLLVPAFARLIQDYPEAHLVLAGPSEDGGADQVRALARQGNIENSITLTGLISGPEKLAALQDADAFVLPSRFEGLSIALLEALYNNLPVLITNQVGLCGEVEQAGAGVVVHPHTEAIYRGLRQLADASVRAAMRGRGREMILRKYTWDAIAQQLIMDIREAIS